MLNLNVTGAHGVCLGMVVQQHMLHLTTVCTPVVSPGRSSLSHCTNAVNVQAGLHGQSTTILRSLLVYGVCCLSLMQVSA